MDAPLSSPTHTGPQHSYFSHQSSSSSSSSSSTSAQPSGPTSAPQTQSHQQQTRQAPAPAQVPTNTASPFLRDFNLVAEAAKRAQMAVLMRDMEGVAI